MTNQPKTLKASPTLETEPRPGPARAAADGILEPWNRKYLGAKFRLLPFLESAMIERTGVMDILVEPFAGTGALACHLLRTGQARRVVLCDILRTNTLILHGCLGPGRLRPGLRGLRALVERLNDLDPSPGYVTEVFGGRYFTLENAARIDAVRSEIARLSDDQELSQRTEALLVGALLMAADRVANTVGQYDAYLKNLDGPCYDEAGRHLVDGTVHQRLRLRLPRVERGLSARVYEGDLLSLLPALKGDVAYLDPPYNQRQYCDNYHVLENIARWEKPPVRGVTAKFDRTALRSDFSRRREVARAFAALIEGLAVRRWLFLSYSDEGILSHEEIGRVLAGLGEVEVLEVPYRVFGNGGGRSRDRMVVERLYCVAVRRGRS